MQSFDTKRNNSSRATETQQALAVGRVEELPLGSCKTIDLPEGRGLALYNVDGEFYATRGRDEG